MVMMMMMMMMMGMKVPRRISVPLVSGTGRPGLSVRIEPAPDLIRGRAAEPVSSLVFASEAKQSCPFRQIFSTAVT
jgi:hypothetical protein